jgi:hypothetical protein
MALPGYSAEAGLYVSHRTYETSAPVRTIHDGEGIVAQQLPPLLPCRIQCWVDYLSCRSKCDFPFSATTGILGGIVCSFICDFTYLYCYSRCPPPPPPPPRECPEGQRCCERDNGMCIICRPTNQECP